MVSSLGDTSSKKDLRDQTTAHVVSLAASSDLCSPTRMGVGACTMSFIKSGSTGMTAQPAAEKHKRLAPHIGMNGCCCVTIGVWVCLTVVRRLDGEDQGPDRFEDRQQDLVAVRVHHH